MVIAAVAMLANNTHATSHASALRAVRRVGAGRLTFSVTVIRWGPFFRRRLTRTSLLPGCETGVVKPGGVGLWTSLVIDPRHTIVAQGIRVASRDALPQTAAPKWLIGAANGRRETTQK